MIEIVLNDRLGKKVRVKCNPTDTIGDLKKIVAAQTGTKPEKIRIQKWYTIYKDHISLQDYEIHDGMAQLNLVYPLLFQLFSSKNPGFGKAHCGVVEFTAEEGRVYIPLWMMNNIGVEPNDYVSVHTTALPRGTFVKFKPKSVDFLDISDPRAVLERILRKYAALTIGETILFRYNEKDYWLEVLELKPQHQSNAVTIIETDLQVDFAPPEGYVEPQRPGTLNKSMDDMEVNKGDLDDMEAALRLDSDEEEEPQAAPVFSGAGYRISGKPVQVEAPRSNLAAALSKSPGTSDLSSSPNDRRFITSSGRLVVGSPKDSPNFMQPGNRLGAPASAASATATGSKPGTPAVGSPATGAKPKVPTPAPGQAPKEEKQDEGPKFVAFSGKGHSLK